MALRRRSRHREDEAFPGFTDVVRIGAGGFSTVFRAREIETNRSVALKILNVHDVSEHAIGSFQRETFALGTLSAHPHIVTLYRTLATEDDRPVLVLELCHGSVWERMRDQGPMSPWDSVAVAVKIAGALETAHRAGMLHRDVKPENVLITQYGEPALADFGVARLQSTSQATAGVFGFTTIHAAPELLEGRDLSAATDVYGLASTLYQLIAGKAAFRSFEDEGPASVILRILRDPVQPLVAEGVPVALSDLLVSSMSKNPYDRPASALELADELRSIEAASSWPDTPYAIEETVAVEQRASSRPGRFQVRGVDAPWPASVDIPAERPAPPLILTEPAARPDAPAAPPAAASPAPSKHEPAAASPAPSEREPAHAVAHQPVDSPASQQQPDPASETVFMRSGPGRVEVPRQERRVLTPQGHSARAAPVPIRPAPPAPAPQPVRPPPPPPPPPAPAAPAPPPPPPFIPDPVRVEVVFPLAPDPVPIQAEQEVSEPEPIPAVFDAEAAPEAEWKPELDPEPRPAPEPEAALEAESEPERQLEPEPELLRQPLPQPLVIQPDPAAADTGPIRIETPPVEPVWTEPAPSEPVRIEPAPSEPVRIETPPIKPAPPGPVPIQPETFPGGPAEVPAARLRPSPRFDHLFDEAEERATPTIRPLSPPIGAATAQNPTTWARPRFLSQSFTMDLDDDSNERRTRPTPVVKRSTQAPPIPLRTSSTPVDDSGRDEGHWTGPPTARGADRDITANSADGVRDNDPHPDPDGDDDGSRKSRRRQKRR